jgi:hypothetical protein
VVKGIQGILKFFWISGNSRMSRLSLIFRGFRISRIFVQD